jgi:hypothetical protein
MSDYRFENSVKLFQSLRELKLPSGETLGNGLTCSSPVSLWDVVASYMVYYRFPLLWNENNSQRRLKVYLRPYRGLAGRIRDAVTVHPRICNSACDLWPVNGSTVVFLGFYELFYQEVLQPVAEWLIKNSESHAVVLGHQSSHKKEGEIIKGQNFQSIWGHWNDKVKRRTQEMLKQLRTVQQPILNTHTFDAMVRHANIDVNVLSLQQEFKWFFWRDCRRLIPQIAIAEHILTEHRPTLIVSADDADQRCRIYSLLGQKLGIPSLVVQQGLTHKDYPEWKFFSMSEVAAMGDISRADMMLQGIPEGRITVTGHPGFDRLLTPEPEACAKIRAEHGVNDGQFMVLFASQPYQVGGFKTPDIRLEMIKAIINATFSLARVQLVVKPHPIEDIQKLQRILGHRPRIVMVERAADISLLIKACDVLLTFTSTVALQALYIGKPVLNVDFPESGLASIYLESGATWVSRSDKEIQLQLQELTGERRELEIAKKEEERQRFVRDWAYLPDGGAAERVGKKILNMKSIFTNKQSADLVQDI